MIIKFIKEKFAKQLLKDELMVEVLSEVFNIPIDRVHGLLREYINK